MDDTLYEPLGPDRFRATRLTQGPWRTDQQHGGPVAALLAHRAAAAVPDDWAIPQITVDYLSPVPVGDLTVTSETLKSGRRTACVVAEMSDERRTVARARAWLTAPGDSPGGVTQPPEPPAPLPTESSYGRARFAFGFQEAVEMRFVAGSFRAMGPGTAWAHLRVPLVGDTPARPVERVLALCDFATGVSAEVERDAYTYSNLDLSLHLYRQPETEWTCLDAVTTIGLAGVGVCDTVLFDERGAVGRSAQSLFVAALRA
jgi:hypothetical protein